MAKKRGKGNYTILKGKGKYSRRGTYARIKTEKGYRYIKIKSIKDMKRVETWQKSKVKTPFRKYKTADRYLQQIKKKGTIESKIKAGTTTITTNDFHKANNNRLQSIKKEMLRPLIKDEEVLNIIATPENFKKLKHRLEYRIKIEGKDGEELTELGKTNSTPEEIQTWLKEQGIQEGNLLTYEVAKALHYMHNFSYTKVKEEIIGKVTTTITFRKGNKKKRK